MNFKEIYDFTYAMKKGYMCVRPTNIYHDNILSIIRGECNLPDIVYCKKMSGNKKYDIVVGNHPAMLFISNKVVDLLLQENISGWQSKRAIIKIDEKEEILDYNLFVINGRCGKIDSNRSKLVQKPPIVKGGTIRNVKIGLFFDETTWDGSDIFNPKNTGLIFIKEKVKHLFEKNKITNTQFECITLMENMIIS